MTNAQRRIIVYIATSADGYIARPDGDVEWLNRRPDDVDYGHISRLLSSEQYSDGVVRLRYAVER